MPEILLHYIWQRGLFLSLPQVTTNGRSVQVLSARRHNLDAGPDFTDVHLLIDGIELVGQVEIHVFSSDWYRHRHHKDPAYDSIILHVVRHADRTITNSRGELLPQLELKYDTSALNAHLSSLDARLSTIDVTRSSLNALRYTLEAHPCAQRLANDPSLLTDDWQYTMLLRRLECKEASIQRLLAVSHNDWQDAFYISLAHAFGFHVNGLPMELLARATPLSVLLKHRADIRQVTALLLGQAGLLREDNPLDDPLCREYAFLRTKFALTPIDVTMWKQGRLRPQTSPRLRIEQFARLLCASDALFSRCMDLPDVDILRQLFAPALMGQGSVDSLLINVVAPFLYARGRQSLALNLLYQLPAEDNRIIRRWRTLGIKPASAAATQALLHLYQTCCEHGRCLSCSVWSERPPERN